MSGHRKNKALLFSTVCIFLLCLLQAACAPNGEVDDPESNLIDPDKFVLEVEEIYKTRKTSNWITVKITPGSPSMCAEEFEVTAYIVDKQGIVQGKTNECSRKEYTKNINSSCCVTALVHSLSKAKRDKQGQPITFWVKAKLNTTTQQHESYILKVEVVVYKGSSREHTETKSITLKAKHNGVDTKEQTGEEDASDTSAQTPATALSTVSDNAMQSTNHPTLREDLPVPTRVANTIDTSTTLLGCDTDLPILPSDLSNTNTSQRIDSFDSTTEVTHAFTVNVKASGNDAAVVPEGKERIPTASSEQRTEVPDITEDGSPSSTNASAQQPASRQFTVTLSDATRRDGVRNFVLVTIRPNKKGMALSDFFVTASLSDTEGTMMGSSSKKNGFVYDKPLTACSVGELLLEKVNCLGARDTTFTSGEAISFKIEAKPGASLKQGDTYTLTVQIAYTGSHLHTATESISLTATQKSPQKKKKRATPRK